MTSSKGPAADARNMIDVCIEQDSFVTQALVAASMAAQGSVCRVARGLLISLDVTLLTRKQNNRELGVVLESTR